MDSAVLTQLLYFYFCSWFLYPSVVKKAACWYRDPFRNTSDQRVGKEQGDGQALERVRRWNECLEASFSHPHFTS